MVVVMMVMMMVVVVMVMMAGGDRGGRSGSRRRALTRHMVKNARHGLASVRCDMIDAISNTRHGARDWILSHGELGRDKRGRNAD